MTVTLCFIDWQSEFGGFTCYVANEEDEEVSADHSNEVQLHKCEQHFIYHHHHPVFVFFTASDSVSRGQLPCPRLQRQREPQICQTCQPQKLLWFCWQFNLQSILWLFLCVLWINILYISILWVSWHLYFIFFMWYVHFKAPVTLGKKLNSVRF